MLNPPARTTVCSFYNLSSTRTVLIRTPVVASNLIDAKVSATNRLEAVRRKESQKTVCTQFSCNFADYGRAA